MNANVAVSTLVGIALAALIGGSAWIIESGPRSISKQGVKLAQAANDAPIYITVETGDTAATSALTPTSPRCDTVPSARSTSE